MDELSLKLIIDAQNKAANELKKVSQQISAINGSAERASSGGFAKMGGAMKLATAGALAVGTGVGVAAAGMAAAGVASLNVAATFEQQMSSIKALTGANDQQIKSAEQLAFQLGKETKFSALEAAQGIEELLKAGVSIEDIMGGAAKGALDLAAAGGINVADAATIASTALNAFKDDQISVTRAADLMAGAANASATDVAGLQLGLSQVSAVAAGAGLTFQDTATALAAFANNGLKGSDAGTSLKTMLMNLQPRTDAQIALFDKLGITTNGAANQFFDAQGQMKGMSDIAGILQKSMSGMTDQQRMMALETMFGSDAIRAGNVLFKEGADGINKMQQSMNNFTAADVAAEKMNNLWGAVDKLKSTVETQMVVAFQQSLPVFTDVILAVDGFIASLDIVKIKDFISGPMQGLITYGTFMVGVWKNIFEEVRKSIDQWNNYQGVIGVARQVIEKVVGVFRDQFIKSFQELKAAIQPNIPTMIMLSKIIGGVLLVAIGALTAAIAASVLALIKIVTWSQKALTAVVNFANSVRNAIASVPGLFTTMADLIGAKIREIINSAKEWGRHMLENFAQGIREGFNPIDGAIEGAKAIFNKIAFSKNKDIPSEIWGAHMMQNFAGGIDEGNKEVKKRLDETVKHVKDRIEDFTGGIQVVANKVSKAWSTFTKSVSDAKKTYKENIAEINKDIQSIKISMSETTASFTADIAKINSEFEKNSGAAQKGMATDVASSIVNAQDRQKEAQMGMIMELAKAEQDQNIEKIAEFQKTIVKENEYLTKHLEDQRVYAAQILEVRRVNGLDEIELIKEKHALEQAELQKKRDQEIADAQTAYDKKMADYAQDLVDLQTQKNKELEIYQDAQTKAQNILKKSLEKQKADTKFIVGEMVKEFDRIPAGFSNAFNALGKKMVNAGNAISGKDSKGKSTTNNNKTFSITIAGGAGESQADLLKRLSVLLKTI